MQDLWLKSTCKTMISSVKLDVLTSPEPWIYLRSFNLLTKASFINANPLPKYHATQDVKSYRVSDGLAPLGKRTKRTPWRAVLTGHVKGDNPLSSPSFVDRFTLVQSWHICCLDNKGTYSLWKKQREVIFMHMHSDYKSAIPTTTMTFPLHSYYYTDHSQIPASIIMQV